MRVAVIIPTYREAATIGGLIDELSDVFAATPLHEWMIVVVDANSPDGTGAVVRARAERLPQVHLLVESHKRGIAAAYVTGITHARDALGAEAFVEFDGDGQHAPSDVARLIEKLEEGYDCAIGSRYVPGGEVPKDWELWRRLLSRFGSMYARLLLELPVHDVTSGLKATRLSGVGVSLPLSEGELLTRDYAYKMQFLYALSLAGARFSEIPITFRLRTHDDSKSSFRDIFESLRVTAILRLQTLSRWRFLRVLVIGGIGFLVQAALFELIGVEWRLLAPGATVILVATLAMFTNFLLHEHFSFRDKKGEAAPLVERLTRFFALNFFGSICVQWAFVRSAEILAGHSPIWLRTAYLLGVAVGLIINYAGYYFWVWGRDNSRKTIPKGNG